MRSAICDLAARLLIVATVTTSGAGLAQPASRSPDFGHAAELYRAATAELAAGHYDAAARGFGAAYNLTSDPVLFFKIGLAYEKAGKCAIALICYGRYLKEANPSPKFAELTTERITACGGSAAASAPDYAKGAESYRAAAGDMAGGRYEEAARGFGVAYELTQDPVVFFKIGFAYEKAGNCDVALIAYGRYLKEAQPAQTFVDLTEDRIKACLGRIADIHPHVSSAPIVSVGSGRASRGAETASVGTGKGPSIDQAGIEPAGGPKVEASPPRAPNRAVPSDRPAPRGPVVRPDRPGRQ